MLKEKYLKDQYLKHHGIKGQKWGRRRFQDNEGKLTTLGKLRYGVGTGKDPSKSDESNGSSTSSKSAPGSRLPVPRNTGLVPRKRANIAKGTEGTDNESKTNNQSVEKTKFSGREGEVVSESNKRPTDDYSKQTGSQNGPKRSSDNYSKQDDGGSDDPRRETGKGSKTNNSDDDNTKSDSKPEPVNGGKNNDPDKANNKHRNSDPVSDANEINKKRKEQLSKDIKDTKYAVDNVTSGTKSTTEGLSNMIDAIQKIQRSNRAKNSNVKVMSDAEIEKALYRMNLEQRYNQAKYGSSAMSGAEKAKAALATVGSLVATAGGIVTLALGIKQLRNGR